MPKRLMILIGLSLLATASEADVQLDGTWGDNDYLQGPNIKLSTDLGHTEGNNLFHSFAQFDIAAGQQVTFLGDSNPLQNVISRVTGGQASYLEGTLISEIPNVYLINPNGIMFGNGARLNIPGSFHASTADYLKLADGERVYANSLAKSVFTAALPEAFGFLSNRVAEIKVQGSTLEAKQQNLSLIGGEITLTNHATLKALNGQIHLASVASAGEVNIKPEEENLDNFAQLGNIRISDSSGVGNEDSKSGQILGTPSIFIRGGNFYLTNSILNVRPKTPSSLTHHLEIDSRDELVLQKNSRIWAGNNNTDPPANSGNITLHANRLTMCHTDVNNDVQQGGNAGHIEIKANQLTLTDATISSITYNQGGTAGTIDIAGRDQESVNQFDMRGSSQIIAITQDNSPAGNVSIQAQQFRLFDDATINTGSFAEGPGGTVKITADQLLLQDRAWIISNAFSHGNGGNLLIQAKTLALTDESVISTTTFSVGTGGQVNIQVSDDFSLSDRATILSSTEGRGAGGEIALLIQSGRMAISNMEDISNRISADSKLTQNVFIEDIKHRFAEARQRGAEINEEVFAGGGTPGKVYIKLGNLSLEERMKFATTEDSFNQCLGALKLGRLAWPAGVLEDF